MLVGGSAMLNVTVKQTNEVCNNPPIIWTSDNPSVAVVSEDGVVTALSAGTVHVTASIQTLSAQCTVTVIEDSNIEPEYVDLGLSVKWATFNVGALSPEDFGAYYAWGETEPKSSYDWSTYKWCNGSDTTMTKYCNNSDYGNNGFTDAKTTLDLEDDVAHVQWGGNWRMPTKAEQDELRTNCTWEWYSSDNTEFNGVAGYKVTSKIEGYTGRFIFLPAAGSRQGPGTYLSGAGSSVFYWSSSLYTDNPGGAWALNQFFFSGFEIVLSRCCGQSVRPVCE